MKFSFILLFMCSTFITAQNIPLYVGTYTSGESEGIYYFDFNSKTGELNNKKLAVKIENPSFISLSSNRKYLYAVGESNNFDKNKGGSVNAFSVSKNGSLKFLNNVSSNGAHPCHVSLNENDNMVAVSNYSGGNISIHTIEKNGQLKDAFQVIDHNSETEKSHAHSAKFYNNELFIADLGRNFLAQYQLNSDSVKLNKNYEMAKNAGPRHFEISKKGNFIYVINELNSTISVLKKGNEKYENLQDISTLKADFKGENSCADIHLSKNENFLYGSNRGENSIVAYKINKENGTLKKIQSISVNGDWPRNFTLSPNGKYLLVANQKIDNISVYSVAKKSGELTFLHSVSTSAPVCLLF
jgi:6-phosphogluconolactonase